MSIFSTPIHSLTTADLRDLLEDKAVENARLEFKSQIPAKDETLKKLSSFANTFGGDLVVGVEADREGCITAIPGVERRNGYKQTIVQWCSTGANPPLIAEVSDAIPAPDNSGRVCYVIRVPESDLAPHFLNGRRGMYVRTDEFSHHFEPQLATEHEIRFMMDRRRAVRERRAALLRRTHERFQTFDQKADHGVQGGESLPAFLTVSLVPRYPVHPVVEHSRLVKMSNETRVPWRGVTFPQTVEWITQHESVIALRSDLGGGFIEANIWGMLSYATRIAEARNEYEGIHVGNFVGCFLVFLEHARQMVKASRLTTTLHVEVRLRGVRGVPWVYFPSGLAEKGPHSELDDEVTFSITTTTEILEQDRDAVVKDLLSLALFALNWSVSADDPKKLRDLCRIGYEFNGWTLPPLTSS